MKMKPSSLHNLISYIHHVLNAHSIGFIYSVFPSALRVSFYVLPELFDKVFKYFFENLDCKTIERVIDQDGDYWIHFYL